MIYDVLRLHPHLVPRWAIKGFCAHVRDQEKGEVKCYVTEVIEHDPMNYLVLVAHESGELDFILHSYITNLYEEGIE